MSDMKEVAKPYSEMELGEKDAEENVFVRPDQSKDYYAGYINKLVQMHKEVDPAHEQLKEVL